VIKRIISIVLSKPMSISFKYSRQRRTDKLIGYLGCFVTP